MSNLLVSLVFQNTFTAGEEIGVSEVLLTRPLFLIGRDPRCHLVLADPSAALSHAAISLRDDQYRIKATLPKLEISVNETRIDGEHSLKLDDVIRIGETELRFAESENPVRAVVSAPPPAAIKPAVQVRTSQIVARPAPQRAELAQTDAPAREPVIYFPQTMQQTQGGISPVAIVGALATLALVAGFIITMVGNLNASAARTIPLSLVDNRDGMVRLMMFDADW